MSGGSFNYLFLSYSPAEVACKEGDLREMAKELEEIAPQHPVTAYTKRLVESLDGLIPEEVKEVWKGVEWHRSADWGQDQLDEVLEQTKNWEP